MPVAECTCHLQNADAICRLHSNAPVISLLYSDYLRLEHLCPARHVQLNGVWFAEFMGFEQQLQPVWLARDSERIWRGSYKNKAWKHLVRSTLHLNGRGLMVHGACIPMHLICHFCLHLICFFCLHNMQQQGTTLSNVYHRL